MLVYKYSDFEYSSVGLYCGSAQMTPLNRAQKYLSNGI